MQQDTWYHKEVEDDKVLVELLPQVQERYWQYGDLCQRPLDGEGMEGARVLICGKAPVWQYAYVAAVATTAGARSIAVFQPQQEGYVDVYPLDASNRGAPRWFHLENREHVASVEFVEAASGENWPIESVADATLLECCGATGEMVVSGKGAIWMYASLVTQAIRAGFQRVSVSIPSVSPEFELVLFDRTDIAPRIRSATRNGCTVEKAPGIVVGIVGDPNSGKSVFAKRLDDARRMAGVNGWLLDCDAASPTPAWFWEMSRTGLDGHARQLRESQKLDWTPNMEDHLARQMRDLRRVHDVLIADMPGGKHFGAGGKQSAKPERIPEHREVIMREVDRFVILGRDNGRTARAWMEELTRFGWEDRVAAVLESEYPHSPFEFRLPRTTEKGVLLGTLRGLDRSLLAERGCNEKAEQALEILLRKLRCGRRS